ncbi:plasmid maintenance system antidote protein VapI [Bartonella heixiaziensis]
MTIRNPNRCPTHPGEVLADIIPETGKTKSEIAQCSVYHANISMIF